MALPISSGTSSNSGSLDSDFFNEKVFLGLFSIVAAMIIICNGVFLIILTKKRSLRTPSNILLGALSLSDLLIGLVVQPLWIAEFGYIVSGVRSASVDNIFKVKHVLTWFCILLSFSFIVCSSLDRYIAICFPFYYSAKATNKTHLKLTAACFGASTCLYGLLAAIDYASHAASRYVFLSLMGSSLVATAFSNLRIFTVLRRLSKTTQSVAHPSNSDRRLPTRRDIERKNAVLVGVITAIFFLCYFPFIVRAVLDRSGALSNMSMISARRLKLWTQFLVIANSLVNPVVYYARMAKFRMAAYEVFCSTHSAVRVSPKSSSVTV